MSEPTDEITAKIKKIIRGVESFAAEMKRKNVHLGIGNPPVCVTCGKPWKECQKAAARAR